MKEKYDYQNGDLRVFSLLYFAYTTMTISFIAFLKLAETLAA
jgi:hypothetical protein